MAAINSAIGGGGGLKQSIQLSFSLRGIPNLDTMSKTDSFIILYELKQQGAKTMKVQKGKTEVIYDNLNPDFVTNITCDYFFEESQTFVLEAFDMDEEHKKDQD